MSVDLNGGQRGREGGTYEASRCWAEGRVRLVGYCDRKEGGRSPPKATIHTLFLITKIA